MTDGRHYVYVLSDSDGRVLYVGCSSNLRAREAEHAKTQFWFEDVASRRLIGPFTDRRAALDTERDLIKQLRPLHNYHHAGRRWDDQSTTQRALHDTWRRLQDCYRSGQVVTSRIEIARLTQAVAELRERYAIELIQT